jgi:hypothetical protein
MGTLGSGLGFRGKASACKFSLVRARRGVEPVVPDLVKPIRQNVLDETAQELHRFERQHLALLGSEGDRAVGHVDEPAVGNRYAMSVAAEVTQHMSNLAKRLLA